MGRRHRPSPQPQTPDLAREYKGTDLDLETRLRQLALTRIQIRTEEDALAAVALARGWSFSRLAAAIGVPASTVIRRYRETP